MSELGLSEEEARSRLSVEGPNELPTSHSRGVLVVVLEVAREPMFVLLVGGGILYLLMGKPGDALMLLGFVFMVMGITVVQERRTERALEALRDLSSPRALVVRSGQRQRIASRDVVRGDILLIAEGDRVPADALLRRGTNATVDESLLTGESVPVRKVASLETRELGRPGGDDSCFLFAGTLLACGEGLAEVVATGPRTELGRIGKALREIEPEVSPLQRETGRIVRVLAIAALSACAAVVLGYALTRGGSGSAWREALLAGIAMAMSLLPEEFPVILTVFLALGAWRISRSRVLTRRMSVIETLGAATVLCVDKTGTLTRNQMIVRALVTERDDGSGEAAALTEFQLSGVTSASDRGVDSVRVLLRAGVFACNPDPTDPMDRALREAGLRLLPDVISEQGRYCLTREYPLSTDLLAITRVWQEADSGSLLVASKGAPEAIFDLCRLTPQRRKLIESEVRRLASQGLRLLAVAQGGLAGADTPPPLQRELTLEFLGLVAFEDPLRESVPAAVEECHNAGIRIMMITGDYPVTASSIARQAGIREPQNVMTGEEVARLSESDLSARLKTTQVFARMVPEQKLRIVRALQANGEVVAMTGDGVNDAPALQAAHIGIAMGGRGADVAREAASLVLLDDEFPAIVVAVKLGRRIYDNIRKAITFVVGVHVPIAGLSIAPVIFPGWPLLLLPVHIAFLELIIDPACSLIFEAEKPEADVMRRAPRGRAERLFSARTVGVALAQGLSVLAVCLAIFALARPGHGTEAARALCFATLVVSFITIILVNRSWTLPVTNVLRSPNRALGWIVGLTGLFLAATLYVPGLQRVFYFAPLHADDLALSLFAGIGSLLCLDRSLRVFERQS